MPSGMKQIVLYLSAVSTLHSFMAISTFGQSKYFVSHYGHPAANDQAFSVQRLPDGSIYLAGHSDVSGNSDPTLLKTNKWGDSVWMKTFGNSNEDQVLSLNRSGATDLILTGERMNDSTGTDVLIQLIDSSGALQWESIIQSVKNESGKYIEETQDGGFVLCGFQSDDFGYNDIFVARLNATGSVIWTKNYGGTDNEYANQVHELQDGSLIVTADTRSKGVGGYDVEILKLTPDGDIVWDYTYGDEFENGCQGILPASNGDLISYGETELYPFSPFDFFIERISPEGMSIWKQVFGGVGSDAVFSLLEDSAGNFVLTGYSNSFNSGEAIDVVILKTDETGIMEWAHTYGSNGIDIGYGILETKDGFLVGATTFVDGSNDFGLISVSHDGLITAVTEVNAPTSQPIELSVFPNPCTGEFTLLFSRSVQNMQLQIFDIAGQLVYHAETGHEIAEIAIEFNGTPGLYWLFVQDNQTNWVLPVWLL